MKRSLLFFLLSLLAFLPATAGPRDSLYLHMVELAMEGNLRALRPLYAQYRDSLPPMYRLACDLTVADDDCDDARFVECIDSLDHFYSHHIPAANRAVWAVQKAAALCRLGRYPDAAAYCERELKRLDHDPQPSVQAKQLVYYRDKGLRYADTLSVRGRILGLTDRGDIEGLLRLCAETDTSLLDAYPAQRLRLTLGEALNRPDDVLGATRLLLTALTDSLDTDGARSAFTASARVLAYRGEWDRLGRLCATYAERFDSTDYAVRRYAYLAQALAGCPPSQMTRPAGDSFVMTSYDWPLTTTLRVNGRLLPDVIVDTGSPFTLLTRSDAETCGVRLLADTVETGSAFGPVMACTGYADEVILGEVRLQHIVVLVRLDDASRPGQTPVSLLGLNDLRRIGRVEFHADRLVFPRPGTAGQEASPNFYFHAQGIRLPAIHEGRHCTFSFDTGAAAQVLSAATFRPAATDTARFVLHAAGADTRLPFVVLADGRAPDYDGMLGMGFVRCFRRFVLDFTTMRITGTDPVSHTRQHRTAAYWINRGDWFGLERNAASLSRTQNHEGRNLTRLFVAFGKNRPDSVVALAERQLRYPGYDTATRTTFMLQKEHALEELGRYAEAAALLDSVTPLKETATMSEKNLTARRAILRSLSHEAPPAMELAKTTAIRHDADGLYPVSVNGRTGQALIDLNSYRTTMPRRLARRMKVRIVTRHPHLDDGTAQIGVIDSLRIGHAVFRNLVVNLVKDKKAPITLGLDLLRHTGQVRLTRDSLALTPKGTALPKRPTLPLRMAGGRLWLPAANEVHAPYDDVTLRTSQDSPSLTGFLRKQKSLTLDFEHMRAW